MRALGRTGGPTSALLLAFAAGSWAVLMRASFRTLYVEPTDEAISRAAAARPLGIVAATLLVVFVLAAAAVAGRRWLMVLALPGAVAGGWLILAPDAHGAAFLYGVAATLLAVVVAAVKVTASVGRRSA